MAPVALPYLQAYRSRGTLFHYYRRNGLRTRLPGAPGSPEFLAAYAAAHEAAQAPKAAPVPPPAARKHSPRGTFAHLVESYLASADFLQLAAGTRRDYQWLLRPLVARAGDRPVASLHREWIKRRQAELVAKPRTANYMVAVLRKVLDFGVDANLLPTNPAAKIKPLRTGPGHRVWTEAEIAALTGPDAATVALPVLLGLYTAQRLGDVLRLPWSAYDGRQLTLIQGKTRTKVIIPVHPDLRIVLDATPRLCPIICTSPAGRPWTRDHFIKRFAATRADLKIAPDVHFHGLRHTFASSLAEQGGTDAEIQSLTGHKSRNMVELYTRAARQSTLATAGVARMPSRRK